jgi:hypothetical protein
MILSMHLKCTVYSVFILSQVPDQCWDVPGSVSFRSKCGENSSSETTGTLQNYQSDESSLHVLCYHLVSKDVVRSNMLSWLLLNESLVSKVCCKCACGIGGPNLQSLVNGFRAQNCQSTMVTISCLPASIPDDIRIVFPFFLSKR